MFQLQPDAADDVDSHSQLLVFATMGLFGLVGCLLGGWAADRFGRSAAAVTALAVHGPRCLLSPRAFDARHRCSVLFLAV